MKIIIKKITKGFFRKDIILAMFSLVLFGSFIFANQAHAQLSSFLGIPTFSSLISTAIAWVGTAIAWFIGLFVMVAVWLCQWALELNTAITSSKAVKIGIGVTLSLTNIGFVTILIIIALATILRRESYGVKNLLAKLIIAALLVNFSLPIASSLMAISDQFTYFFLQNFPGGTTATGGLGNFAESIGFAFQPQAIGVSLSDNAAADAGTNGSQGYTGSVGSAIFSGFGSLAFSIVFPLAILITLIALFIMLMIRYVYLGILLILMPLAWVAWVAPATNAHWKKWWEAFSQWLLFSPILMMFLYIALQTTSYFIQNPDSGLAAGLVGKGITSDILTRAAEQIIIVGLIIGGLFAAKSVGGKAGGMLYGAAQGMSKSVGNYAKKQGTRAYTSPLRSKTGQSVIGALSRSRIPGITAIGRGLGSVSEKGGKDLVEGAAKEADKRSLNTLQNNINGRGSFLAPHELMGELQSYMKRGGDIGKINPDVFTKTRMFENFGQTALKKEAMGKLGVNDEILGAREDLAKAQKSGDTVKIEEASANLAEATSKYIGSLSSKSIAEMPNNLILPFNKEKSQGMAKEVFDIQQQAYITAMVKENPRAALSKIKDLNPSQFKYATNLMVRNVLPKNFSSDISNPKESRIINQALSEKATDTDKNDLENLLKQFSPKFYQEISGKNYRRLMPFLPMSPDGAARTVSGRIGKNPPRKEEPPVQIGFSQT